MIQIIRKWLYYKDHKVVGITDNSKTTEEEAMKKYLKWGFDSYNIYEELRGLSRIDYELKLMDGFNERVVPEPTSFPKFSSENQVIVRSNGYKISYQKIINIRWDGLWEYRFETNGHKSDWYDESKLEAIKTDKP